MAEREGFEPPDPCGSTVFKTAALNHSATSPKFCILPTRTHPWCAARPAPPCAVVRWRGETLSLSAKTPAHPLGHLSDVLHSTDTHPSLVRRPARTSVCGRSLARRDVKSLREFPASPACRLHSYIAPVGLRFAIPSVGKRREYRHRPAGAYRRTKAISLARRDRR